jgi:hypothetical protein
VQVRQCAFIGLADAARRSTCVNDQCVRHELPPSSVWHHSKGGYNGWPPFTENLSRSKDT